MLRTEMTLRGYAKCMGAIIVLLTIAQAGVIVARLAFGFDTLLGLVPLFQLNAEANIPTWFQSANLLLCALFAAAIATGEWQRRSPARTGWAVVALALVAFSMDETGQLHDRLSLAMEELHFKQSFLFYPWVIAGAVFVLGFGGFLFRLSVDLPVVTRQRLAIGFAAYFGSALGLEFVEGMHASRYGTHNLVHMLLTTVEEVGEMVSILYLSCAFLAHLRTTEQEITISLGRRS